MFFPCPPSAAYTSDDVTGIQLGGALKNIFASEQGFPTGSTWATTQKPPGHARPGGDDAPGHRHGRPAERHFSASAA